MKNLVSKLLGSYCHSFYLNASYLTLFSYDKFSLKLLKQEVTQLILSSGRKPWVKCGRRGQSKRQTQTRSAWPLIWRVVTLAFVRSDLFLQVAPNLQETLSQLMKDCLGFSISVLEKEVWNKRTKQRKRKEKEKRCKVMWVHENRKKRTKTFFVVEHF